MFQKEFKTSPVHCHASSAQQLRYFLDVVDDIVDVVDEDVDVVDEDVDIVDNVVDIVDNDVDVVDEEEDVRLQSRGNNVAPFSSHS